VVIALGLSGLLLAGVVLLVPLGLRTGDRSGDALLLDVQPAPADRSALVTLTNPGRLPVLVGMSLRRPGLRLRFEGPGYVRVRNGQTSSDLLAGRQSCIEVLEPGETATFAVPAEAGTRRRAELVVVIGQACRLRTIHRLVVLAQDAGDNEAAIANSRRAGMLSVSVFDTQ